MSRHDHDGSWRLCTSRSGRGSRRRDSLATQARLARPRSNRRSPHRCRICSPPATTTRARDLFAQIVSRQQRRASRIAWHYLRDAGRSRRGGAGCLRQGVHAHQVVPAASLVRGLADADSDQRVPRSPESADAPIALDAAGRRCGPPRSGHHRPRDTAERSVA